MRCPSIFRMLSYDGTRFPASYILSWLVVSALQVSQALSCFYFKHNMLEFAGIPEGRFTLPGSGNPDNNLELCARYASAFGMDAASVVPRATGKGDVCAIHATQENNCPSFSFINVTSITDITDCEQEAMSRALLQNTYPIEQLLGRPVEPPFGAKGVQSPGTGSAYRTDSTSLIGATLQAPIRAANDLECLELCANWIEKCAYVVVESTPVNSSKSLSYCMFHSASAVAAVNSPGFHTYSTIVLSAVEAAESTLGLFNTTLKEFI